MKKKIVQVMENKLAEKLLCGELPSPAFMALLNKHRNKQ